MLLSLVCTLPGCSDPADSGDTPEFGIVLDGLPGAVLSIWGDSKDNIFAVGGDLGTPTSEELILWYDGSTWTRMDADAPTLWWVHGFGPNDVWAVGESGTVVHYDGDQWTTELTGAEYTIWGIWGASTDDLWAAAGVPNSTTVPGTLLHYDGIEWTEVTSLNLDNDMYFKIWGSSASDVWVISQKGKIIHYDGSDWSEVADTGVRLVTINGRASDDIYAVGGVNEPEMLHYDGQSWEPMDAGFVGSGLMGVWPGPEELFVSGFSGLMAWGTDDLNLERLPNATEDSLHGTWGDGEGNVLASGGNLFAAPGAERHGVIVGTGDLIGGSWTDL